MLSREASIRSRLSHLCGALIASFVAATCSDWNDEGFDCSEEGRTDLYDQRIAPLFLEERPKSCNQCHLSGVDLQVWIKPTPCQTMACMIQEGLVDVETPEDSLLLSWIDRAEPESAGITDAVLAEEREGILEWIQMTKACGNCDWGQAEGADPCERESPYDPDGGDCLLWEGDDTSYGYEDPGDCSDKTLETLFMHNFMPWRRRCYPCHFESFEGEVERAPKWIAVGPCEIAALQTYRNVTQNGYIDIDDPKKSIWMLKPLEEELGGIQHGGGPKFHAHDETGIPQMMHFAERWAACQKQNQ